MAICNGVEGGQGLLEVDGTEGMTRRHDGMTEIGLLRLDRSLSSPGTCSPGTQRMQEGAAISRCPILLRTPTSQLPRLKQTTLPGTAAEQAGLPGKATWTGNLG